MSESGKDHWERVYGAGPPDEQSWHQAIPERSMELIRATGEPTTAPILDVGGGASTLVDRLQEEGYSDITVLDFAGTALSHARNRLGEAAARITWIETDVTRFAPTRKYAIWHDRALLHFLVDDRDRRRYLHVLRGALRTQGHVVLAVFGPGGPSRCSGLPVRRYAAEDIGAFLGSDFRLRMERQEEHRTPAGTPQQFVYGWWQADF